MLKDFKSKATAYLEQPVLDVPQGIAQSTTQETEEGFFQSLVKPATELGKDLAELTPAVKETRSYIEELRKTNPELADKTETLLGEKPTFKKVVGDVVGTALLAVPLPIAKIGIMSKIASPLLKFSINGGGYMAAFSAADAASQNKEAGEIAKSAGLGFLAGMGVGSVGYLGIKGFTRLASLKPFQNAYNAIAETETSKVISQYMRPVADVLSTDFGTVGKDVVNRLYNADRNVQGAVGRIMRIMDETGSKFGLDDVGREQSYQLGKNLRGRMGDVSIPPSEGASQFNVLASTFREKESENISKEVFNLATQGKYVEAAEKSVTVYDKELGSSLKELGIKVKETDPMIGVWQGSKEPSVMMNFFGALDDKTIAKISEVGSATNQDAMFVVQTKIGNKFITKADAEAQPMLKIKVPGLSTDDDVNLVIDAISEVTQNKIGQNFSRNLKTGEVVIINSGDRAEFEALAKEVKKVVESNKGSIKIQYVKTNLIEKQNYANNIQKALGAESRGIKGVGNEISGTGRITGRFSKREGSILRDADGQESLFGSKFPEDIKSLNKEEFYRALLGDVAAEAESRGVKVRVPAMNGERAYWTEFKPIENYFPQQVAELNEMKKAGINYGRGVFKGLQKKIGLKPKDGRLRNWVVRRSVEEGDFKSAVEAEKALDGYIEFVEKEGLGVTKENGWVQYMIKSGQVETEAEAFKVMRQVFKDQSIVKLGGSLEHARIVNNPFYNPFPDEVVPLYAIDSITRMENIEQFGSKYTGESAKLPGLTKAIDNVRKADGRNASDRFEKFLDVAMNRINNATDEAKFVYYARMLQIPKLSFAQIVNVGQSVLNPLLKTDMKSTFIGLQKAFTNEGVKTAMESGATVQSVFNEMVKATAAGGNFADKWLKVTGFIWTEKFNRTVAANVGVKWAERNFETLLKNPTKISNKIRLEELGINVEKALKRGSLTGNEKLRAAQIMAEKTQFRSRPMDLPIWASSNTGKLFWQFKNFMYNQFLFVFKDNLANEIKNKQYGRAARNILILGTVFPMAGEVLQDVRSLVTQTRRPTKFLDRYLSDIASVGSMALVSDLVDAVRFDSTDQFIMPPALSSVTAIVDKADDPEEMLKEIVKQTGIGAPIINVTRERREGRASTLESIQDILSQ